MIKEQEYIFKIVIIGDQGVGKSSLFLRSVDEDITNYYKQSDSYRGQECQAINMGYFWLREVHEYYEFLYKGKKENQYIYIKKGAEGIILMYDITDDQSFNNIKYWLNSLEHQGVRNRPIAIIGNKSDLEEKRKVATDVAKKYCQENNLEFYEISSKTQKYIIQQAIVELLAKLIVKKDELLEKQRLDSLHKQQDQVEAQKEENSELKVELASLKQEVQELKGQIKNITEDFKSEFSNLKQKILELENELQKK